MTAGALLGVPAVGAYIGAAYWFTSSTSFANPAITLGRMFSDPFDGIVPASVIPFILTPLAGGALAVLLLRTLYTDATPADGADQAADVVLPHPSYDERASRRSSLPEGASACR